VLERKPARNAPATGDLSSAQGGRRDRRHLPRCAAVPVVLVVQ
jgi:hypothetical protein